MKIYNRVIVTDDEIAKNLIDIIVSIFKVKGYEKINTFIFT